MRLKSTFFHYTSPLMTLVVFSAAIMVMTIVRQQFQRVIEHVLCVNPTTCTAAKETRNGHSLQRS